MTNYLVLYNVTACFAARLSSPITVRHSSSIKHVRHGPDGGQPMLQFAEKQLHCFGIHSPAQSGEFTLIHSSCDHFVSQLSGAHI